EAVARAGLAAAKSTGSLGEMAATLSSLIPGLGAAGAGLGALALAAAPVAIALGGVVLAFGEAQKAAQAVNAAFDQFFAKRYAEIDLRGEDITRRAADARLEDLKARRAELEQLMKDAIAANEAAFQEAATRSSDAGARLGVLALDATGGFEAFNENIEKTKTEITDIDNQIAALNTLYRENAFALEEVEEAVVDNTEAEKARADNLKALEKALDTLAQKERAATNAIANFNEAMQETADRRALQDLRAS